MFSLFSKSKTTSQDTQEAVFKISGMHCVSCSLNIDGELEDIKGVVSAETSYAKAVTKVVFDPNQVTTEKLAKVIEGIGYTINE